MTTPLTDKHIILGVTGSIACYKAADLASKLTQAGALVDVILSEAATRFITPLTFQSVTGRKAYTDADLWRGEGHVVHIGLGQAADLFVVAPITANTMAKLAHGAADTLLTVSALAADCPLLIAPAMDGGMFQHPATQANLATLQQRGAVVVGPAAGHLASGLKAVGRMVEPLEILGHIRHLLAQGGPLAGRKVVVTAGGTQEALDPVRFIGNHSSGKQGFALAQAALDLGAEVTLVAAPTFLETPIGARRVDVKSARDMLAAVLAATADADALIMAAAVADFRPAQTAEHKLKKEHGVPAVDLARNPDILLEVAGQKRQSGFPRLTVGFAAESKDLHANAQAKLAKKSLDLIVANDIRAQDAGFAVDTNRVVILSAAGTQEELPLMDKAEVAAAVMARVQQLLEAQHD